MSGACFCMRRFVFVSPADITVLGGFAALEPLCCAALRPQAQNRIKSFLGQLCRPKNSYRGGIVPCPQKAGKARCPQRKPLY